MLQLLITTKVRHRTGNNAFHNQKVPFVTHQFMRLKSLNPVTLVKIQLTNEHTSCCQQTTDNTVFQVQQRQHIPANHDTYNYRF
jgi:hypothetical protein